MTRAIFGSHSAASVPILVSTAELMQLKASPTTEIFNLEHTDQQQRLQISKKEKILMLQRLGSKLRSMELTFTVLLAIYVQLT